MSGLQINQNVQSNPLSEMKNKANIENQENDEPVHPLETAKNATQLKRIMKKLKQEKKKKKHEKEMLKERSSNSKKVDLSSKKMESVEDLADAVLNLSIQEEERLNDDDMAMEEDACLKDENQTTANYTSNEAEEILSLAECTDIQKDMDVIDRNQKEALQLLENIEMLQEQELEQEQLAATETETDTSHPIEADEHMLIEEENEPEDENEENSGNSSCDESLNLNEIRLCLDFNDEEQGTKNMPTSANNFQFEENRTVEDTLSKFEEPINPVSVESAAEQIVDENFQFKQPYNQIVESEKTAMEKLDVLEFGTEVECAKESIVVEEENIISEELQQPECNTEIEISQENIAAEEESIKLETAVVEELDEPKSKTEVEVQENIVETESEKSEVPVLEDIVETGNKMEVENKMENIEPESKAVDTPRKKPSPLISEDDYTITPRRSARIRTKNVSRL